MFLRRLRKLWRTFANEATLSCVLQMQGGNLGAYTFTSTPPMFVASVSAAGAQGPIPGAVKASHSGTGTAISLANLTAPGGFAQIRNLDPVNTITIGLLVSAAFQSFLDLLPGESYVVRLASTMTSIQALAATADSYIEILAHNR